MDGFQATRILTSPDAALTAAANREGRADRTGRDTPSVLVLTTFLDDTALYDCLRAGAAGFLLKSAAPRRLADAVRVVASGDAWLDPAVAGSVVRTFLGQAAEHRPVPVELHRLTVRERELLALAAHGLTNEQIAAHLIISEATVRTHLGRVMAKLGVHDRAQAVVVAYRCRLVHADDPLPSR
jgi:DNA-binding NarL/FixJ family response regulator